MKYYCLRENYPVNIMMDMHTLTLNLAEMWSAGRIFSPPGEQEGKTIVYFCPK